MKNYLLYENTRNHINHKVQEDLVRRAFGQDAEILVAHHITYELPGQDPIEIPSADTLLFDYDIMTKVFGDKAQDIMHELVDANCDGREAILVKELAKLDPVPA